MILNQLRVLILICHLNPNLLQTQNLVDFRLILLVTLMRQLISLLTTFQMQRWVKLDKFLQTSHNLFHSYGKMDTLQLQINVQLFAPLITTLVTCQKLCLWYLTKAITKAIWQVVRIFQYMVLASWAEIYQYQSLDYLAMSHSLQTLK